MNAAIASRLCTACRMCCDGTLFEIVRMQPGDSPAQLSRHGMRMRCRDGEYFMEQPCAALLETGCTIYSDRPSRCRQFNCQQLHLVEAGQTTEADAMAAIGTAHALAAQVRALIEQSGLREDGQPLAARYQRLMSTPVNAALEPEMVAVRAALEQAMQELRLVLNRDFRPPPGL